jgi:hypothetical protein
VKIHRTPRNHGGYGVLVDHLSHGISEQNHVLIKRFNVALQLDAINKVNRHRNVLATQQVQKRVLEQLPFIGHDILRVGKFVRVITLTQGLFVPYLRASATGGWPGNTATHRWAVGKSVQHQRSSKVAAFLLTFFKA